MAVLFAYPIKLNISTRKEYLYQRSCVIILIDLSNAIKKMLDKISFHKYYKVFTLSMISSPIWIGGGSWTESVMYIHMSLIFFKFNFILFVSAHLQNNRLALLPLA